MFCVPGEIRTLTYGFGGRYAIHCATGTCRLFYHVQTEVSKMVSRQVKFAGGIGMKGCDFDDSFKV